MLIPAQVEAWAPPTPTRVLGQPLRPFSLWHQFQLEALENPLLVQGGDVTMGALFGAVKIMRTRYPVWASPEFGWLAKLRCRRYARHLPREFEKLAAHCAQSNTQPEFWQREGGSAKHGVPAHLFKAAMLISNGFTEQQAWDMPCGKAAWYATAFQQAGGAEVDLVVPIGDDAEARLEISREYSPKLRESLQLGAPDRTAAERLFQANLILPQQWKDCQTVWENPHSQKAEIALMRLRRAFLKP